ncbi:MAG: hypothetical protein JXB39_09845 [Deltaproteobacteria bacterium]|nr:hypothetical protein [Deltaproteobacteria bacterium]
MNGAGAGALLPQVCADQVGSGDVAPEALEAAPVVVGVGVVVREVAFSAALAGDEALARLGSACVPRPARHPAHGRAGRRLPGRPPVDRRIPATTGWPVAGGTAT